MGRMTIAAKDFHGELEMRRLARRQLLSGFWSFLVLRGKAMAQAYVERRRVNRAVAELSALSNRMLRDIGVERSEIQRVARYGRDADRRD